MNRTDIPRKLPVPFANAAGSDYRREIPEASQIGTDDGAASLQDGFPPLTGEPLSAGGIPPDQRDFNGILYAVSAWSRWVAAGNPAFYDGDFATKIGGYPYGAVLASLTLPGTFWANLVDGNMNNPDISGGGWQNLAGTPASQTEVNAGSNNTKFVTPATLAGKAVSGADLANGDTSVRLVTALALSSLRASYQDMIAGTDGVKYATPAVINAMRAAANEIRAGQNDRRLVTPSLLADAFGRDPGVIYFPGNVVILSGEVAFSSVGEPVVPVTFPFALADANYFVQLTPMLNNPRTVADTWVDYIRNSRTTSGFNVQYQRPSDSGPSSYLDGFQWEVKGRI